MCIFCLRACIKYDYCAIYHKRKIINSIVDKQPHANFVIHQHISTTVLTQRKAMRLMPRREATENRKKMNNNNKHNHLSNKVLITSDIARAAYWPMIFSFRFPRHDSFRSVQCEESIHTYDSHQKSHSTAIHRESAPRFFLFLVQFHLLVMPLAAGAAAAV